MDGVSTYLALTFGTLLSSQGTDASFETVSPASPGASLRCFQPYQTRFPTVSDPNSVSDGRWRGLAFRLPRLYQNFFRVDFHPRRWAPSETVECSGFPSGGAVNVLERGSSMQIGEPRRVFSAGPVLRGRQGRPPG
ncbi:hypothetical protein VT50_0235230 [Streptomyces antioxidans]|uniref:Uncharacterized protein n=1 Tax=Streptomyces antioxidans TaxID=1507734 RepID=A0A1V4CUL5_9ACTN|nr:hypothetical protein VT50_0235230 [Streptomyces antioxidans]